MWSPNYSGRGGAPVTTIVLHTAEGARTYRELGNFFANPNAQVSSHVGIDDTPGVVGEYVRRDAKAWTAANANPWSVQAELCAFARWGPPEWAAHPTMLANTAAWIAEEAAAFNIPLNRLGTSGAQNPGVRGVCQHSDLGAMGGGHWDCGPAFPIDHVLDLARGGGAPEPPPPEPPPPEEDEDMANLVICAAEGDGRQYVTDLVTFKTPINGEAAWNHLLVNFIAAGNKLRYNQDMNDPIRVPKELLDPLPETRP